MCISKFVSVPMHDEPASPLADDGLCRCENIYSMAVLCIRYRRTAVHRLSLLLLVLSAVRYSKHNQCADVFDLRMNRQNACPFWMHLNPLSLSLSLSLTSRQEWTGLETGTWGTRFHCLLTLRLQTMQIVCAEQQKENTDCRNRR